MKKLTLISIIFVFCTISVLSQTDGQITIKKGYYYLNDKKIHKKELKTILLSDPESALEYNKSKKYITISLLTMSSGLVLMVYGEIVMDNAKYNEANYGETTNSSKYLVPILAGVGLSLTGIIYYYSSRSHSNAIPIYNSKHKIGYKSDQRLDIGITQNGIGIVYRF
jgi:hypothetical protein